MAISHNLGFPRIGAKRELKKAVESYWRSEMSQDQLKQIGQEIRREHWKLQHKAGLNLIPVGDFSWYDHVLTTSALLGVVPERFGSVANNVDLDTYFCIARGQAPNGLENVPSELTKWFDTNYHYIVPEFSADQSFRIASEELFESIDDALSLDYTVKPVLLGPITYLYLGKSKADKLNLLDNLLIAYTEILERLENQGIEWVQIDEPILTLDLEPKWKDAFRKAYQRLAKSPLKLLLTTYFGELADNLELAVQLPTAGLHVDLCSTPEQFHSVVAAYPKDRVLSLGIVNGRNIWRNNLSESLKLLKHAHQKFSGNLWVAPSCSLLHSPVDLDNESKLNSTIKNWLAFAKQKVAEVATLTKLVNEGSERYAAVLRDSDEAAQFKRESNLVHNFAVQQRLDALTSDHERRRSPYSVRKEAQNASLQLPLLPTTTIGSFPQTNEIRGIRRDFRLGKIDEAQYQTLIQAEITRDIRAQEKLGLDVLVHGESERNDMVEYFGELLNGFAFTGNGWVQSYGSRCVKPPIIYGDVSRKGPMTIDWIRYAQSQTEKLVKGMLTGPVTILAWSFPRDDQPIAKTTLQIALALRDEVVDLENAGIKVIQIDEPAFREKVPLRHRHQKAYFDWAIRCFRIAAAGVQDKTQIHTHMCYSDFNNIIAEIAALDADVITIESSRSDMELLKAFEAFDYPNDIGPGVYDIHSPRIPTTEEIVERIQLILNFIPAERLWINPDCGLKTRGWNEINKALKNMVDATHQVRELARSTTTELGELKYAEG